MTKPVSRYPVQFSIAYPKRPLNRLTTFFRLILAIPIFIVLMLISGFSIETGKYVISSVGLLFFAPLVMILFRKKYPRWWFNWNLEFLRFQYRIIAYLYLLRDEYPSTDEEQAVDLDLAYPDASKLNRFLPLVKWFLAIPHYIVLFILSIIVLILVILAWFAILFTAKYPRFIFDFVVGYMRWAARVMAYAFILITDKYPPFSLH